MEKTKSKPEGRFLVTANAFVDIRISTRLIIHELESFHFPAKFTGAVIRCQRNLRIRTKKHKNFCDQTSDALSYLMLISDLVTGEVSAGVGRGRKWCDQLMTTT